MGNNCSSYNFGLTTHTQQVESDNLEEPDLPANYQMEEYVKARTHTT